MYKFKFLILLIIFANFSQLFAAELVEPYLDKNVKIVLSEDFRGFYARQRTAAIIPDFSFAANIVRERSNFAASGEFMTFVINTTPEESSFLSDMMSDVGEPLSEKYMETDEEFDDTILTQPSLYADISSAVLSYFFRKLTQGRLDLVLLTPPLEEPSDEIINGVEVGVRLTPRYGVRVKILDNGTMPTYGMVLEFFPMQNVSIKLSHEIISIAPDNSGAPSNATNTPDVDMTTPDAATGVPDSTVGSSGETDQKTGLELNIKF